MILTTVFEEIRSDNLLQYYLRLYNLTSSFISWLLRLHYESDKYHRDEIFAGQLRCVCVLRLYASRLHSRWSRCSCRKKCQVGDTTSPPVLLKREQQKNRTLSSFLQLQRLHNTRWRSQIHIAYWQWHQKWRNGRRQRKRTALNHDQTSKLQKMQQTDHIDIYVICFTDRSRSINESLITHHEKNWHRSTHVNCPTRPCVTTSTHQEKNPPYRRFRPIRKTELLVELHWYTSSYSKLVGQHRYVLINETKTKVHGTEFTSASYSWIWIIDTSCVS